jgi:type IV pilus assembly protein PilM
MELFKKKAIGVDIADRTIEVAELINDSGKIEVLNLGRIEMPLGVVKKGKILDRKKLKESFEKLFSTAKPKAIKDKKIIFSLPEHQVYIHTFSLKSHDKEARDNLVLKEARTTIPLDDDDLIFSYRVLKEDLKGTEILLVATSKKIILDWYLFFDEMNVEVEVFDVEDLATFRNIFLKDPENPICIVDIGEFTSNIDIFDNKGLRYSYAANLAGDYFTKKLSESLEVSNDAAEKVKMEDGLVGKNKIVFDTLDKAIGELTSEVNSSIKYFEDKEGVKVEEVILLGSSSKMKGIMSYFKNSLNIPVRRGEIHSLFKTKVPLEYMGAVGSALRGIDKKWEEKDPAITISKTDLEKELSKNKIETVKEEKIFIGEDSPEEAEEKKIKKQKIFLIIVFVLALIAIGSAFWYRSAKREERKSELVEQTKYKKQQTISLKVEIIIDKGDNKNNLRGRVIEDAVELNGNKENKIEESRLNIKKQLKESEDLILESAIEEVRDEEEDLLRIKWLTYNEKVANSILINKINEHNDEEVDYILNLIKKRGMEKVEDKYYLLADVDISLDKYIKIEEK